MTAVQEALLRELETAVRGHGRAEHIRWALRREAGMSVADIRVFEAGVRQAVREERPAADRAPAAP